MADGSIRVDLDTIGLRELDGSVERLEGCERDNRFPILCLLYTSPSPRDLSTSRMPSSA